MGKVTKMGGKMEVEVIHRSIVLGALCITHKKSPGCTAEAFSKKGYAYILSNRIIRRDDGLILPEVIPQYQVHVS